VLKKKGGKVQAAAANPCHQEYFLRVCPGTRGEKRAEGGGGGRAGTVLSFTLLSTWGKRKSPEGKEETS